LSGGGLPPSTNIEIRLERGGHDFELMQVQHYLKARPFSNLTSSAKKNITTEPISMFVPDWFCCCILIGPNRSSVGKRDSINHHFSF